MREIKFRAWHIESRLMWDWGQLLAADPAVLKSALGNEFFATNPPRYGWEAMQYTGLKDKNGVEIYEGDVVSRCVNFKPLLRIIFDDRYACFTGEEITKFPSRYASIFWKDYEVIGNIYENPELCAS